MKPTNPFLDNIVEYQSINQRINDYQYHIEAIKRDLEAKTKMLIESRTNHKKAMEAKAKKLIDSCTHLDENEQPSIDKTHSDILTQIDNKLIKHSYCSLCGHKFKTGETEITPLTKQTIIDHSIDYTFDDGDGFVDTMEFNVNFDSIRFLDGTNDYFGK